MSAPTLINLPPPPSDPLTPSEAGPGTPGSTTTSMSELSTVAIKDGHRGHPHHHQSYNKAPLTNQDSERADRISRLPGLERLTASRQNSNISLPAGASASNPQGYFDAPALPVHAKERSTVGSASATGSVGGHTTWADGSDQADTTDKMSMSEDMETSSVGAGSDNGSLVGFGEGAGSTVSGPISGLRTPQRQSYYARITGKDPRESDGMTSEGSAAETSNATPSAAAAAAAAVAARRNMGADEDSDVRMTGGSESGDGKKPDLGSFDFEAGK